MPTRRRVLILGGTGEARVLAELATRHTGVEVVSSLAGRTAEPALLQGKTRVGGFGGVDGLAAWVAEHHVDAVIDATHPFASTISRHAAEAAARVHVPLLALRRAPWVDTEADRWHPVRSLREAADSVPGLGRRALLTIGRQGVHHFSGDTRTWYLLRCIDPPTGPLPRHSEVLLARGPFRIDGELNLLRDRGIDLVVTKNSGGPATSAKLEAARRLHLPVVVVERPAVAEGVEVVETPHAAMAWLVGQAG